MSYHNYIRSIARFGAALAVCLTLTLHAAWASADKDERANDEISTIEWTDLIPKDDLEALLNPPDYISEIEDGSLEDEISGQLKNSTNDAAQDRYQEALASTKVAENIDGKFIQIPGFIVPLEFDDDQTITQFLLVPYFGACIHLPPPPPNQIIFVNSEKGFRIDALYTPFWVKGVISTTLVENETATSAYSMEMIDFEPYL